MTDISIPPEALEAGGDIVRRALGLNNPDPEAVARAAFLAMVSAWSGMVKGNSLFDGEPMLFLPIPQEQTDDQ